MPTVPSNQLQKIAKYLLTGAGVNEEEAQIVSLHSINANLAGHDSHGIIQIPVYIDRIKKGDIIPGAPFEIVQETSTTTVVDGHWGFGYVVSEKAMNITIEKAKKGGVAATTVFQQGHVGRVSDYPIMATKAGMIGIMTADSGRSAKQVVPFGGREPRLGTNPIAIAMPSNLDGPIYIDMATSAVAAGKLSIATARGNTIPEGWLLDHDGRATTDPRAYGQGGSMLPLGGKEGHKGYGLSVMVEIFSGILTGLGFGVEPSGRHNDGCFMAVFNVETFRPLDKFKQEVTEFAHYLKDTPLAEGFSEVFYPGEIEYNTTETKLNSGIEVEESTWTKLSELANEYGVSSELEL